MMTDYDIDGYIEELKEQKKELEEEIEVTENRLDKMKADLLWYNENIRWETKKLEKQNER